jgi:hypothetical protein
MGESESLLWRCANARRTKLFGRTEDATGDKALVRRRPTVISASPACRQPDSSPPTVEDRGWGIPHAPIRHA